MALLSPNHYICFKLSRAMRKVQRYYETHLAKLDITPVQFYVVSALWEEDGVKFKELAKKLSMDGATLTGIVDRLERQGFVKRVEDIEDKRSLLLFLGAKAKLVQAELGLLAGMLDKEIKDQFDEKEFSLFVNILDQIGKEDGR